MIDLKNDTDKAIYNVEQQLREHGDKIPQNVKDQINGDITSLNEAVTTEDTDKIKEALERLKNSQMEIGKSIYAQGNTESTSEEQTQSEEPPKEEENQEEKKEDAKEEEKKKDN